MINLSLLLYNILILVWKTGWCLLAIIVLGMLIGILWCRWTWSWTLSSSYNNRRRRRRNNNNNNNIHEEEEEEKDEPPPMKVLAFFHPYCSAGGGGERVLWKMIQAIEEEEQQTQLLGSSQTPSVMVVIYTVDPPQDHYFQELRKHVQSRFDITITGSIVPISFVHLHEYQYWLRPSRYISLVMESFGTMCLVYHALRLHRLTLTIPYHIPLPHVFFDTTGCAFTYPMVKWLILHHTATTTTTNQNQNHHNDGSSRNGSCRVVAYVHYPTISTDMLQRVYQRRPSYNHPIEIAKSTWITHLKLMYYIGFAMAYGLVGSMADLVLVNSTWTYQHIQSLWGWIDHWYDPLNSNFFLRQLVPQQQRSNHYHHHLSPRIQILFPPCNVSSLIQQIPLLDIKDDNDDDDRQSGWIVSIGQFRPEKDHPLQLRALALLLQQHPELRQPPTKVKLILIGSCRHGSSSNDERRVNELRQLANELQISDHVIWVLNQSTTVIVQEYLSQAGIGLHSMWNEHFGIAIVEMMAAGLIVIAHNSGGPQTDIIGPSLSATSTSTTTKTTTTTTTTAQRTGFLASTIEEYAEVMYQILLLPQVERRQIRQGARESVKRFSDDVFVSSFRSILNESGILSQNTQKPKEQ